MFDELSVLAGSTSGTAFHEIADNRKRSPLQLLLDHIPLFTREDVRLAKH